MPFQFTLSNLAHLALTLRIHLSCSESHQRPFSIRPFLQEGSGFIWGVGGYLPSHRDLTHRRAFLSHLSAGANTTNTGTLPSARTSDV